MEGAISSGGDSSDPFFDASDDSAMPDFNESLDSLPSSPPGMTGHQPENEGTDATLLKVSATSLRRRRSSFRVTKPRHNLDTNVPTCESDTNLEISTFGERQGTIPPDIEDMTISNGVETTTSTLTSDQNVEGRDIGQETSSRWDEPSAIGHEYPAQSILDSLTDLVIKAIFFQKTTLWVCKTVLESLSPFIPDTLKREERIVKLVGGMAWGCFWFFYVGIALSGLLITSFFWANFLMSRIVEEPLQMIRSLSFDYTKASPDALVMLMPCNTAGCGLDFVGKAGFTENVAARAIPPNHKLQLTISLTLPESDYNINLGVFQVSVEFISTKGKITSRSSKPCMLRFKSSHIRFMETFIRSGPLLAGYSSESQVIDLRLSGFTEGYEPTMSVRIVLEQRAGFMLGAGIPEIYSASLKLESKLPILKRIIWNWRKTLLIWLAMGLFVWELLIVLVCCRPVLFPQGRRSGDASHNNQGRSIDSSTT
ncbi:seipin-3 isoform X2 [Phalaenopsis equestris]|uniref:seipin-3 isoform X2 n=1 Tax=Phalaenopsis equestris TaxID=78828 RepID=UPI0009E626D3|nr:seipin-3 isoform X2 [Phalaenopsis equestris]